MPATQTGQGTSPAPGETGFLCFVVVLRPKPAVPVGPVSVESEWSHVKQARRPLPACSVCPFGTELVSVFVFFSDVSELLTSRNWVLCIFFFFFKDTGNLFKSRSSSTGRLEVERGWSRGRPQSMCRDEGRALVLAWGGAGCWGHAPHPSPLPAEGTLHPDNPQHCLHCPASPLPSETPSMG